MLKEKPKISCSIFRKQESIIQDVTGKINRSNGIMERAGFAEELIKEVDVLLSCSYYNVGTSDCKNCHFNSTLRKRTACLILKAKKLA